VLLYNNGDVALNAVNPMAPLTSAIAIVDQNGAALFVPSPVCDKNFLVVVVLPGNDNGAPALFE
jgi:hypothetical protein